jgi:phospholipase C
MALVLLATSCAERRAPRASARSPAKLRDIETVVVIYAENRSFDNLYGLFPGADGVANARDTTQVDHNGTPLPHLPAIRSDREHPETPTYAEGLPNAPFRVDAEIGWSMETRTRDLVHRFYQHQEQIDRGRNDRFAAVSNAGALAMGFYDGATLPMWSLAREYTLADHFFQAAFGGSFLNHQWLICACTPRFDDAPLALQAKLDAIGRLQRTPDSPASALEGPPKFLDGALTRDGFAVNTLQPPYQPSGIPPAPHGDPTRADASRCIDDPSTSTCPLPPQHQPTIGDRLSDKHVAWAWYAGAWDDAGRDGVNPSGKRTVIYQPEAGAPNFQPHHQPFNYFQNFAPGTAMRTEHLEDYTAFTDAIDRGTIPPVAFYKPQGNLNEHPGYATIVDGDRHVAEVVERLMRSPQWPHLAIFVLYDENGGWWDHVAPPAGDVWGPGTRIPAIVISPFAKRHYVDHTAYDTTSILQFITRRFALEPLPGVRRTMGDLTAAFDFAE